MVAASKTAAVRSGCLLLRLILPCWCQQSTSAFQTHWVDAQGKLAATAALQVMANTTNTTRRHQIRRAGALPPLVALLKDGACRWHAAAVLHAMSSERAGQVRQPLVTTWLLICWTYNEPLRLSVSPLHAGTT